MERLGLWGEGTPSFAAFQDFLDAVGGRGVGALELVAMDMKARGMFVCRTLSFQGAPHRLLHASDPVSMLRSATMSCHARSSVTSTLHMTLLHVICEWSAH